MFQDRPIKRTLLLHLILLCNCRPTTTLHSGTHTRSRELNLRPGFASTEDYFSSRHDLHQAVGPSALSKPLPQKLTKDSIFFFASDQRSPIDSGLLNSSPVGACCRARAFSTNRLRRLQRMHVAAAVDPRVHFLAGFISNVCISLSLLGFSSRMF